MEVTLTTKQIEEIKHELMMAKLAVDDINRRISTLMGIATGRPVIIMQDGDSRKPAHADITVIPRASHDDDFPEEYTKKAIVSESKFTEEPETERNNLNIASLQ